MLVRPELSWSVAQRLGFIETQLYWEGSVNRGDLVNAFDISVPQSSKDLALYQQQVGDNLVLVLSGDTAIVMRDMDKAQLDMSDFLL